MRLFKCQSCGQALYFENTRCEQCGHQLGYLPQAMTISALEPDHDLWRALAAPDRPVRMCDNAGQQACNWLVEADGVSTLCAACRHNHMIPDLTVPLNHAPLAASGVGKTSSVLFADAAETAAAEPD